MADYYAKLYGPPTPQTVETKDAQVDAIKNIFGVTLADSEITAETTILTVEEQREIALKVVFGIFATLAAGLLIAFIHNQLTEANPKPAQKRQVNLTAPAKEFAN